MISQTLEVITPQRTATGLDVKQNNFSSTQAIAQSNHHPQNGSQTVGSEKKVEEAEEVKS